MSSQSGSNDGPGLFDDLPLRDKQVDQPEQPKPRSTPPESTRSADIAKEADELFDLTGTKSTSKPESVGPPREPRRSKVEEEALALFELNESAKAEQAGAKPPKGPATQVPLPKTQKAKARPDTETRPVWKPTVTLGKRIGAGSIDLLVNLLVLVGVDFGLRLIGVEIDRSTLLPLVLFALSFSFLYFVFPLAFWGRTPGMARTEIVSRSRDGQSLSFSQAARRWVGALLTLATLGIPILIAGKSGELPADRLSQTQTYPAK